MANDKNKLAQGSTTRAQGESSEVAALKTEIAELRTLLMATIQSQPKVTPDSLWAQNHQREMAIKEELDRQAAFFMTTAQQRTQWAANRINLDLPNPKLFKVQVGWCPEIVLRAKDDISAVAYYNRLCGIRGVETNHKKPESTTYAITDVTSDPEAQKLANSEWQYQAAA